MISTVPVNRNITSAGVTLICMTHAIYECAVLNFKLKRYISNKFTSCIIFSLTADLQLTASAEVRFHKHKMPVKL